MFNTKKSGIALISLTIVIIVLVMLASLVTYASYDIISESQKVTFAKDITTINDAIEEYYTVNGSLPIFDGGVAVSVAEYKEKITQIRDEKSLNQLVYEIELNDDSEATFYEIDLSKIEIDNLKYGVKSDENDIFMVSNQSNKVYYLKGYDILSKVYFSNTSILEKN